MPTKRWADDLPTCGCPAEVEAKEAEIRATGFDPWDPVQASGVTLTCQRCSRVWAATPANLAALREFHAQRVVQRIAESSS